MKPLTLDAFLSYRFLSELNLSPDGSKAALVVTLSDTEHNSYQSNIWLQEAENWKQLTSFGKEKDYIWEDNTHILFPACRSDAELARAKTGEEFTSYYRISTDGGEATPAFTLPFRATSLKRIDDDLFLVSGKIDANHPDYAVLSAEQRAAIEQEARDNADYEVLTELPFYGNNMGYIDKKRSALFLYHTKTGAVQRITDAYADAASAVADGNQIYYLAAAGDQIVDRHHNEIYVYDQTACVTRQLARDTGLTFRFLEKLGGRLIAAAETSVSYEMPPEAKFYSLDPATGALSLFADPLEALGNSTGSDCRLGKTHSHRSKADGIYFLKTVRNAAHLARLNSNGTITDLLTSEGSIDDFDVAPDGNIVTIAMYGGKLQEVYQGTVQMRQSSSFNETVLSDVYVAPYRKLTIRSGGWDIDGWVLLPKDYDESKSYPAILDIHGGPRTVYSEVFYHEMQLWANLGYFVFFCNPVGSSGRGVEFADLTGRYGQIDYQNIMDFTDAVLEAYPQIDRARLGCTGGSYGGFMCNWIMGHTDRFAAIATQRSISNWVSFYGVSDIGFTFTKTQMGNDIYSEAGLARLWDHSPLKYINQMKTPTLFIHSTEDYRCPLEQGLQLYTALQEKGVPTRFCMFKGENHELSRSGKPLHRKKRLEEITAWMERYLKA